jgi:hypothetical protein
MSVRVPAVRIFERLVGIAVEEAIEAALLRQHPSLADPVPTVLRLLVLKRAESAQ